MAQVREKGLTLCQMGCRPFRKAIKQLIQEKLKLKTALESKAAQLLDQQSENDPCKV